MLNKHRIGVCMDGSIAYLLQDLSDERLITIIEAEDHDYNSDQTQMPETPSSKSIRRRQRKADFFQKIFEVVKDFEHVSLFGPVASKNEILRRINANKSLHIQIQNHPAENDLTESQRIDFINQYFQSHYHPNT